MGLQQESKTYKPFFYPWAVELTRTHEEVHWTEDEAELSEDVTDWAIKLSLQEKAFVTNILRLFTQSDAQVGQNYHDFLIPIVRNNEVRVMLSSFAGREGTHQRAYALLNDTLGLPDEEYHAFLEYKEMSDKIGFMQENSIETTTGKAFAFAKTVGLEGISLFASFAMLLNFQRSGKMKGMNTIVEWSIRDETLHVQGNAMVFRQFCAEHPQIVNDEFKSKLYKMIDTIVSLEDKFIDLAFAGFPIAGITAEETKQYIRCIADRRLIQLGLKEKYHTKSPFDWLDWIINGVSHDNFFEKRVSEYSVNGMVGEWGYDQD
jgi:ribonucleotide reductase beta subunit family protein with ferritin-like domain